MTIKRRNQAIAELRERAAHDSPNDVFEDWWRSRVRLLLGTYDREVNRADDNFASYERVKAKYSEHVTLADKLAEAIEESNPLTNSYGRVLSALRLYQEAGK